MIDASFWRLLPAYLECQDAWRGEALLRQLCGQAAARRRGRLLRRPARLGSLHHRMLASAGAPSEDAGSRGQCGSTKGAAIEYGVTLSEGCLLSGFINLDMDTGHIRWKL